jgi:hypothetical protein
MDRLVNAAAARPTAKQAEDAAEKVHVHVRQAASLALAGDWRRAHAEAEAAQGAARKFKEILGIRTGHAGDDDGNKPAIKADNPRPWKAKRP